MEIIELEILYQDEYLIAVNKPSGMLVHRSWLDRHETVFVMQTLRDQLGQHVFPLHRLDRPTSGVLLFGLSSQVASMMMPLFAGREMHKTYYAITRGWIKEASVLDYPLTIIRDKIADKKATKAPSELQEAVTAYWPMAEATVPITVGRYPEARYGLLKMQPETGRKHQLRRHLHHLSHPIIGDVPYGDGRHNRLFREYFDAHRLMLHAATLAFIHPVTQQSIVIEASVDETWQRVFHHLGWQGHLNACHLIECVDVIE
jgi:tRNA pseudouridine65 synthase